MDEISQEELLKKMRMKNRPVIIDVRSGFEYDSAHIRDAIHIPFHKVLWNRKKLPGDRNEQLILTCEHGPRAVLAKRLLWIIGYKNIRLLQGHMANWKKNRLPTISK